MVDYKTLYFECFAELENAITTLMDISKKCEEKYLEASLSSENEK